MTLRTHCVSIRLSPVELAQLDQQRGAMSRGTYMRRIWSGARLPRPMPAVTAEALDLLRRMSANLNQLAKSTNAGQDLDYQMLTWLVAMADAMIHNL